MKNLRSYLSSVLAIRVSAPKKDSENLMQARNSTFAGAYNFYEISLSGIPVIVAERISSDGMNGSNVAKEYRTMKEYFPFPVLLEISLNDAVLRRQLTSKNVNFVVPGHQLYFPELYISMTESRATRQSLPKRLTISAQVLLLYHLQRRSLAGISFKEIAGQIGYSAKTVSLVVAELCNFGIAKVVNVDHHKALQFHKRGAELYLQVDKWLQSPVMASGYTDRDVEKMGLEQVGYGVLNSVLPNTPQYRSYGISSKQAKEQRLRLYAADRKYAVEIWKYDPALIGTDGYADVLSVLLSWIETINGYAYRHDYDRMKKSVLEKVEWADTGSITAL